MTITEVVNMVTAFAIATGTVSVPLALLGHALVASRFPTLQRIGKILEGVGWDLKRVSEAFKKGPPKDPPEDPPGGDQTPVAAKPIPVVPPTGTGLSSLALALVLTVVGCASSESKAPSLEQLKRFCPAAFIVMTVECPDIAMAHCPGAAELSECPDRLAVEEKCDRRVAEEMAKCKS